MATNLINISEKRCFGRKSIFFWCDDLKDIDKVRLAIHLLEELGFVPTYDINIFIKLLRNVLLILYPECKNAIINFVNYKTYYLFYQNIWNYHY